MSPEFQFCNMKSYGDTDGGDGGPTLWIYLISLNCVVNSGEGDKFVLCVFCHHKKLEKINYKNKMLSYYGCEKIFSIKSQMKMQTCIM